MSGTEQIQSDSEVSHERGPIEEESETSPDPSTDYTSSDCTTTSDDFSSQEQLVSVTSVPVANESPPRSFASGSSTSRCNSSFLQQLLASPAKVPPITSSSQLKAAASETSIQGATEEGYVPAKNPSEEAVGPSVPAATVAEGGNVPEAIPPADASSDATGITAAGAVGDKVSEVVSVAETGCSVPEAREVAAGSNVPDILSTSGAVGDKDSGAVAAADETAAETKEASSPDAVPNADAVVPETVSVTATEVKRDGVHEKISIAEDGKILKRTAKDQEPTLSSEEINFSEAQAKSKEDKDSEESKVVVSEKVIEAQFTKDPVPDIEKGGKSGVSSKTTGTATGSESLKMSELHGKAVKTSEPKSAAEERNKTSEPTEDAMEISEPTGLTQTSKPDEGKQDPEKISSKEAEKSPLKRPATKGRLGDLKSDELQTPESPRRKSNRLATLARTASESPGPKKERKTPRASTLERSSTDDTSGIRTRARRVGSASSNSEMEGSGDEIKPKRVSRKDSKK